MFFMVSITKKGIAIIPTTANINPHFLRVLFVSSCYSCNTLQQKSPGITATMIGQQMLVINSQKSSKPISGMQANKQTNTNVQSLHFFRASTDILSQQSRFNLLSCGVPTETLSFVPGMSAVQSLNRFVEALAASTFLSSS